eukprot:CAMPEP_0185332276 /NCGR_PEP_ID=MMETSP1363-20130426/81018_1 /TAXON_ID=38817 /ORGANISM="Gephyrocapsa oceanica, Strain RCC1303" /LENGTH=89 /DNA_ID=CAMNT_0027931189 /DNA_START=141 /DNA_END=411 /DNA_ORIENTATION=-
MDDERLAILGGGRLSITTVERCLAPDFRHLSVATGQVRRSGRLGCSLEHAIEKRNLLGIARLGANGCAATWRKFEVAAREERARVDVSR